MMEANERLHRDWIGMAQPEGLVVTPAALKAAEANITWPVTELQAQLSELASEGKVVLDLHAFHREILGWSDEFVVEGTDLPDNLRVHLDGGEVLAPTLALRSADDPRTFVLLVLRVNWRTDLDAANDDNRWTATAHQRFERLLRESGVPVGLLTNGRVFRLVYTPKGESAGWVNFRVDEMLQVAGRELLGAMHMLLNERRLLSLEDSKRLSGLLKASREYQNTVSNRLREQVLSALRELLLGFQQADRLAHGAILGEHRRENLQEVYSGLVTVLMRMVFALFAEERGLLPMENDLYANAYSLSRLHAQLQDDRARHGDTLNDRYGAWARVISLFRLLHDGVIAADGLRIPARKGDFFDPDKHPFLEGRPRGSKRRIGDVLDLPRVSDGVLFRVLDQLFVLDGERLQYRGLDVEQIGSVYEGLMGFDIEVADGDSISLMPEHVVVNLETLAAMPGADRIKMLKAEANLDVKDKTAASVRAAKSVEELHAALSRRVSSRQPCIVAKGTLYLQPGQERRRTGAHYTPRSLTAPIVETTLRPVLERLGEDATPEQLLDLKVCDPAMGSGAFLVEACRQLADHLVAAWRRTGTLPELPPDEDPVLHARRLIAQRCLYGVDKNPLATDLARLSLWLVTFAREHPFTFVDHALRHGDSLVGLSREQIASLTWEAPTVQLTASHGKIDRLVAKAEQARAKALAQLTIVRSLVDQRLREVERLRREIHAAGDVDDDGDLARLWRDANDALAHVRLLGDAVIASYFAEDSDKARRRALDDLPLKVQAWLAAGTYDAELRGMVADLREGDRGVPPFHWEIEFPEVFGRENAGFDCFVGNPPFAGKNTIAAAQARSYPNWLLDLHDDSNGNSDLVAHFFRRTFAFVRRGGTLGLVATNTIAQGDTRATGLRWICRHGGVIYTARRRHQWEGAAAVVVSIVHVVRGPCGSAPPILDDAVVERISAFLFHKGGDEDPVRLHENENKGFQGPIPLGMGFTFDDENREATPLHEMRRLVAANPKNQERIFPYLGGDELNSSPTHLHRRFVINFGQMTEDEARRWPDLMKIVEAKVKPTRLAQNREVRARYWWRFGEVAPALQDALRGLDRCLAHSFVSKWLAFCFVPATSVVCGPSSVFCFSTYAPFAVLQCNVHGVWAKAFASSLEDRLQYTRSDCFETFPFPPSYESNLALESIGRVYYEHRAALMIANNEGLTKTYNRFHDADEQSPAIRRLRELHAEMDRAVLDAYAWTDIRPVYDFREQLDESIRLTWDDDSRDEVLARLLELNRVMAAKEAEEAAAAKAASTTAKQKPKKATSRTKTGKPTDEPILPGVNIDVGDPER
ncbi:MAG: N-6 DNA methylase [Deltaproteobacteria bacterium]|nr:N-6 DNA methylase [Deltaproteobacteria bacterium]